MHYVITEVEDVATEEHEPRKTRNSTKKYKKKRVNIFVAFRVFRGKSLFPMVSFI